MPPQLEHQIQTPLSSPSDHHGEVLQPQATRGQRPSQFRDLQPIQEFLLGLSPQLGFLFPEVQLVGKTRAAERDGPRAPACHHAQAFPGCERVGRVRPYAPLLPPFQPSPRAIGATLVWGWQPTPPAPHALGPGVLGAHPATSQGSPARAGCPLGERLSNVAL